MFTHIAKAQTRELYQYDHDSKPYYFGITLGSNMSRFQTSLHSHFLENDSVYIAEPKNSNGFALGLLATTRLSDRFQLRVMMVYIGNHGDDHVYFNRPVSLQ